MTDIIEDTLESLSMTLSERNGWSEVHKRVCTALTEYRKRKNVSEEELEELAVSVLGLVRPGAERNYWEKKVTWKQGYRAAMERITK